MALYSYQYSNAATGWDALIADLINFETTFSNALWAPDRISPGTVVSRTASGHEVIDGWQEVVIRQVGDPFGYTKFSELTTYVTAVHGGWTGEDAEISLHADLISGSYGYFNVIAHLPRLGRDYSHVELHDDYVRDLGLRYTLVNSYTPADAP